VRQILNPLDAKILSEIIEILPVLSLAKELNASNIWHLT
jgi:hypothetical protein